MSAIEGEIIPRRGGKKIYEKSFAEEAYKYCLLGATVEQLAELFDVAPRTINKWIRQNVEFGQAVKAGREQADAQMAESLYQNGLNGNVTAQIFWLKNRQPERWREKHEVAMTASLPELLRDVEKIIESKNDE